MHQIKVLIDAGVDPLSTNYAGNTLLHLVLEGSISSDTGKLKATISLLLKHGVNPGAQNHLGQTPLHYACGSLQAQVFGDKEDPMDFLLDSPLGAYLDTADYNGILPIHLAVAISENLVAKLINRKIDTRAVTHEGRTVLHIAARTRQPNVIGLLLEHFSAPSQIDLLNVVDDTGRTALHEACRSGRQESVTLLLRAGADVYKISFFFSLSPPPLILSSFERPRWLNLIFSRYKLRTNLASCLSMSVLNFQRRTKDGWQLPL